MLTLDLQGAPWSEDIPSVEWTGDRHCPGVTMTKTRMWREEEQEEEEREEQEGVWRGREWEVAGRGGSRAGNQAGAGKTAEPGQ